MKKIGILGGMSYESTLHYCQDLNNIIRAELGGLNSVRIAMSTVNFAEVEPLQRSGEWDKIGALLNAEAQQIEAAGADFMVIATNTMHKVADQIMDGIKIPLLHIADATGDTIKKDGVRTIGLLGTSYTMEQDFYKGRLAEQGLTVLVPTEKAERSEINRIIFKELCKGILKPESEQVFQKSIKNMAQRGAEGIILGCTEIGMLVKKSTTRLYDTTAIHVRAAAMRALGQE